MTILKTSSLKNEVIEYIKNNSKEFCSFENVYLFGSVLNNNKHPEDIDILLIYSQYSDQLLYDIEQIRFKMHKELNMPIDFTVLSKDELKETNLLIRIQQYHRIK